MNKKGVVRLRPVNPISLADRQVKVVRSPSYSYPAVVHKVGNRFQIELSNPISQQWAKDVGVSHETIELGLMYHEIAHISFGSFNQSQNQSWVAKEVDNIIEDLRVEHQISYQYPYVAKFISIVLIAARNNFFSKVTGINEKVSEQLLKQLYCVARLGVVLEGADPNFIDFIYPRLILAKRSNRGKAAKLSNEIANYIEFKIAETSLSLTEDQNVKEDEDSEGEDQESEENEPKNNEKNDQDGQEQEDSQSQTEQQEDEDSEEDSHEEEASAHGPEAGDGTSEEDKLDEQEVEELFEEKMEDIKQQLERLSFGHNEIKEVVKEDIESNDYFRTVISRNADKVLKLHKTFNDILNNYSAVKAKEGEISIKRMQEAYVNSKLGEEDYDYQRTLKNTAKFDCVIIRDISGSTEHVKDQYAKIVCIISKALDELENIRVAMIDFNSYAEVIKDFDSRLINAKIYPKSDGGTYFEGAMKLAERLKFKNELKLGIIVTDGCFHDLESVVEMVKNSDVTWLPILFGPYAWMSNDLKNIFSDYEKINDIEELHAAVTRLIKRKVRV